MKTASVRWLESTVWGLVLLLLGAQPAWSAERVRVGAMQSRALWFSSGAAHGAAAILVPGSGPQGPEEMIPGDLTLEGTDVAWFEGLARELNAAGVHVLALGKPGVEHFSAWDAPDFYYDFALYSRLRWVDLVANVSNAIDWIRTRPEVDPTKIFLVGHSEGTQVVADVQESLGSQRVAGLLLLGLAASDMRTTLEWQLYRREIEWFVARDVDQNQDGRVTRTEAARWPEFRWQWREGQNSVTFPEIETALRADPNRRAIMEQVEQSPLYSGGVYRRGSIAGRVARLTGSVTALTGEWDVQTPATEARSLEGECRRVGKVDCRVEIIPGVGHGFSAPRSPRGQPLLDLTLGPISSSALARIREVARRW